MNADKSNQAVRDSISVRWRESEASLGRSGLWPIRVEFCGETARDVLAAELGLKDGFQIAVIESVDDPTEGVGAGECGFKELVPETCRVAGLIEGVETSGSGEEQDEDTAQDTQGGDARCLACIGSLGE